MDSTSRKNRRYGWAVVSTSTGRLLREENDRRAVYRTRDAARAAARRLGGRPVRRDEVVSVVSDRMVSFDFPW